MDTARAEDQRGAGGGPERSRAKRLLGDHDPIEAHGGQITVSIGNSVTGGDSFRDGRPCEEK